MSLLTRPNINTAHVTMHKNKLLPSLQMANLCSVYLKHTYETVPNHWTSFSRKDTLDMSSIVPLSERPFRPFIEAFWTILEGIALLLKGTSILCAAIILNAGLLFARAHNFLMTPAVYFIIALNEIHRLLYGTAKPSVETRMDSLSLPKAPRKRSSTSQLGGHPSKRTETEHVAEDQHFVGEELVAEDGDYGSEYTGALIEELRLGQKLSREAKGEPPANPVVMPVVKILYKQTVWFGEQSIWQIKDGGNDITIFIEILDEEDLQLSSRCEQFKSLVSQYSSYVKEQHNIVNQEIGDYTCMVFYCHWIRQDLKTVVDPRSWAQTSDERIAATRELGSGVLKAFADFLNMVEEEAE
ncbi:hypothetical protein BKA61DRAFT_683011 [Leptodontidium sp. MPI-SDFR-AT-0119]|nr:hypothetical protein BKA61DRAFT_683011 [Leptodontidium sp. MPI-SDFR-AT-0119]